jgi:hypothetical protein
MRADMASLYYRGNSIWIRYRSSDGTWKRKATGYRRSNAGERRQAAKLCDDQSLKERTERPANRSDWSWVAPWVETRWQGRTLSRVRQEWCRLELWLAEMSLPGPVNVTREACVGYVDWRKRNGGGRNTAANEIGLLAMIFDESIARGHLEKNPARNLRIKRAPSKPKEPFTDKQLAKLDAVFASGSHSYQFEGKPVRVDSYSWLHVSYLLGRYQASRLQQARVPLSAIDFESNCIHWPAEIMKGGKAFTQQIDPRLAEVLPVIIDVRQKFHRETLADMPILASMHWRRFLDSLEMRNVSHHSLRVRWISEAAKAGWPEAAAMRFSNHSSVMVARIYQKFSPSDVSEMLKRLK